jgi:hypothetical protein
VGELGTSYKDKSPIRIFLDAKLSHFHILIARLYCNIGGSNTGCTNCFGHVLSKIVSVGWPAAQLG